MVERQSLNRGDNDYDGYIAIRIPETEPFSREGAALAPALKWLQYMTVI